MGWCWDFHMRGVYCRRPAPWIACRTPRNWKYSTAWNGKEGLDSCLLNFIREKSYVAYDGHWETAAAAMKAVFGLYS